MEKINKHNLMIWRSRIETKTKLRREEYALLYIKLENLKSKITNCEKNLEVVNDRILELEKDEKTY